MLVVLLASLAGAFFGGVNVSIRLGLRRFPDAELGGFVAAVIALVVATGFAVATGVRPSDLELEGIWPLLLIGIVVPGASQILYVRAVRDAGPSRAAVVMATSPLLSALLAVAFLSESFGAALAAGTALIVIGGMALTWEPARPHDFKLVGAALALSVAVLLAIRDNVVRSIIDTSEVPALAQAVALLLGACVVLFAYLVFARPSGDRFFGMQRAVLPFLPAGLLMGLVYVSLLEALDRGRVTIVAPLNGTNVLWTVVLSAILLGKSEVIGTRLVLAAVLVVAGGALIGVFA